MNWLLSCSLILLIGSVLSIPIDNGLLGEPEVQCGPRSVIINFNTQNPFEGHVFVKGLFNDGECNSPGDGRGQFAAIELPFETCGTRRERSLNPRGIFVSTTVIISFHPTFITKVDRAIRIQCFYMEADKTVDAELEVSMLTTGLQTLQVPMPTCRYEILEDGPNGSPVRFALIGDQVYHKWTCDTDTIDTFCMTVYDCYVDDTAGDKIQLLDDDGCALDRHLLGNLEYPSDLMAGKEAHVFKYADRANLYFNCQIRIVVKEPGQECARPQCPAAPRGKRQAPAALEQLPPTNIVDVSYPHSILVGDVDLSEEDVPKELRRPLGNRYSRIGRRSYGNYDYPQMRSLGDRGVCMSPTGFGLLLALGAIFIVATLTMASMLCMRKNIK